MKKSSYRFIVVSLVVISILLIALSYYSMSVIQKHSAINNMNNRIEKIIETMEHKQEETERLFSEMKDDYQYRSRVVAMMMSQSPSYIEEDIALEELRMAIQAEEISITDKEGKIIYTTSSYLSETYAYKGFMGAIGDKGFSESILTEQGNKQVLIVGTSRLDAEGIVQITFSAKQIESAVRYADISTVASEYPLMKKGCTAIIDKSTHKYLTHTRSALIGTTSQISKDTFSKDEGTFSTVLNGEKALARYKVYDDKIILAMITKKEIYATRRNVTGWLIFCNAVLCSVGFLAARKSYMDSNNK